MAEYRVAQYKEDENGLTIIAENELSQRQIDAIQFACNIEQVTVIQASESAEMRDLFNRMMGTLDDFNKETIIGGGCNCADEE